jgi:N-acetylmuramoyl-L-alanine amidase
VQTGISRQEKQRIQRAMAWGLAQPASGLITAQEIDYMRSKLNLASNLAMVVTLFAALASSGISKAAPGIIQLPMALSQPSISDPVPSAETADLPEPAPSVAAIQPTSESLNRPLSLASLVSSQPHATALSRELNCLAGAIYFEAKSESLSGQLAVGRVIVARSKSGRFPNSYCGVVFQPSQFSFVRGGGMPGIARGSQQWRNAAAIAQIAHAGSWHSPVEGALYFHAAYATPGWRLARVGRIENHVFYR